MAMIHPLLEAIRRHPERHLLEVRSLSALNLVLEGYERAISMHDIKADHVLPGDYTQWVRCRLRSYNRAKGWRRLILEATGNEEAAFDKFFQLLDEHSNRQPHVVARLVGYKRDHTFTPPRKQPIKRTDRYPDISLVTYTDDPGFFVVRDNPSRRDRHFIRDWFYPSLSTFEDAGVSRDALTVVDPVRFSRISQEAEQSDSTELPR